MKRETNSRIFIVSIVLVLLIYGAINTQETTAIEVHNENDFVVPAYSARYFSVYLNENEAMAGWLRINNGDGIHFFIVDQFAHDEVQSQGYTSDDNAHEIHNYPRVEEGWYYWNFEAPDSDTWYVYFSNSAGTDYAGIQDELDIVIKTDTEAPSLVSMTTLQGPQTGAVTIEFEVLDDCYPVEKVELYVDDVLTDTITNSELDYRENFEGSFVWNTYNWENGSYTVYLKAYDTLGKASGQLGVVEVEVVNGWFDNPLNLILFGLAIVGIIALLYVIWLVLNRTP
ncbi:MAG: hypothetical protein ACTSSE_11330 [Candidatus Thorarchaeota archaeon]